VGLAIDLHGNFNGGALGPPVCAETDALCRDLNSLGAKKFAFILFVIHASPHNYMMCLKAAALPAEKLKK
jgi:hypothetical protein